VHLKCCSQRKNSVQTLLKRGEFPSNHRLTIWLRFVKASTTSTYCHRSEAFLYLLIRYFDGQSCFYIEAVLRQIKVVPLRLSSGLYLYLLVRKRPCYVTRRDLVSFTAVPHDLKIKGWRVRPL
jgi:hypothetical protein